MLVSRLALLLGVGLLLLRGGDALAAAHLTLKEVAQKVVLSNPEVLAKWHAFKSAGGDVDVARAGFYPRLDLTAGIGSETLKQPGVNDRQYTRDGYTLTLNQMLYDGFATASDVKRLDKARLTRYFELLDAAENAALEAGRAYYDVIRYRQLMFLAESNYVEHRVSYEQLLRRAQTGAGRRVDVEHAASRLALAELNLNTEAANLHDVMSRYMRLVGDRPPPVMFGPARLGKDYPGSEPDALKMGLRQNPALRAAVENVEAAQHEIKLRRSAFHPRLDLRLRNETTGNYQGIVGARENNVAELVLSYNIFNGGADVARQRVYVERKNLALELREKSCRDTRQTLSIAYSDVIRLRAQLSNLNLQVNAIEKTRDAYKAQFNIGQRSLLDLLDTENELLTARRTAVNADIDLALAYMRTQAGIGRLLESLGLKRIDEQAKPDPAELAVFGEAEICPPEAPGSYLVNYEALTAKALAVLDANRPAEPQPPVPGRPSPVPSAAVPQAPSATPAAPRRPGSSTAAPALAPAQALQQRPDARSRSAAVASSPAATSVSLTAAEGLMTVADRSDSAEAALPTSALVDRLQAWAAAWSARSYADYANFYAPSFVPADGSSRSDWARQREMSLTKPERIRVEVQNLDLKEVARGIVVTEFEQRYTSDSYSDRTVKVLQWVNVGGTWLIERELARPAVQAASARRTGI